MTIADTDLIGQITAVIIDNNDGEIDPAEVRDLLVKMVNYDPGTLTTAFLAALEGLSPGIVGTIAQNIPPEPGNAVNICWNHGARVPQTGVLWNFILGLMNAGTIPNINLQSVVANAALLNGY